MPRAVCEQSCTLGVHFLMIHSLSRFGPASLTRFLPSHQLQVTRVVDTGISLARSFVNDILLPRDPHVVFLMKHPETARCLAVAISFPSSLVCVGMRSLSGSLTPPRNRPESRTIRSRDGCLTCRRRKVKCDEREPTCVKCEIREQAVSHAPFPPKCSFVLL